MKETLFIKNKNQIKEEDYFQISHKSVLQVYNSENNYLIEDTGNNIPKCIIYFSGNSIYFPNTEDVFSQRIIKDNYFEWKRNRLDTVGKRIFIRDIFKQWYVRGINKKLNNVEKIGEFLQRQTKGMEVITVGSSAGGYAAALFGILLRASHIISFSAQFSLFKVLDSQIGIDANPLLVKYLNDTKVNRYYDLKPLIIEAEIPIFYLYPGECEDDIKQMRHVSKCENVFNCAINKRDHGIPCYPFNLPDLLNKSRVELERILTKLKTKKVSQLQFSIQISGILKTTKFLYLNNVRKKLKQMRRTILN